MASSEGSDYDDVDASDASLGGALVHVRPPPPNQDASRIEAQIKSSIESFLLSLPLGEDNISAEIEQHVAIKLYNAEFAKRMAKDRTQQCTSSSYCQSCINSSSLNAFDEQGTMIRVGHPVKHVSRTASVPFAMELEKNSQIATRNDKCLSYA
ncbi:hypothetical protein DUNSADRAFT_17141 [Dunaliella salina]|uniref:Encoded protein n=1 Tax=Dunaliella salina TaxID=3046 RepID=A0ABQ7G2A0_DUNSA|nr:hypothetical protein DUNSADRAFT_17141 [Dunaliella salina]|eukprot:KAF5828730.1 hypothetical protein DUNSADRAFT_17141 [Dunaliella salina]